MEDLISEAVLLNASDIHIEPYEAAFKIRYRCDGLLREYKTVEASSMRRIISRIKVLAGLDIARSRTPQDGQMTVYQNDAAIACRVSSCPLVTGEKLVIRLLVESKEGRKLDDLGMPHAEFMALKQVLALPEGMILVTGPTGSGKSVTLYAMLQELARTGEKNIVTIEDPVEIKFANLNQIEVNPGAGFNFATALRAVLRQDPDVIMIGEIRDRETAAIAVHAATSGHLVLATLHTRTASSALQRMALFGIQPQVLDDAITMVLAQRLVRKHTAKGFSGRIAIFEIYLDGGVITSLATAGQRLVNVGVTTQAEISRVLGDVHHDF